ncbi:MAG: SH3 domain-containing protein [Deltaproteobacteria bacterium]|nr:SH3 domain-containing protein [Deltaproteobacteria bacterium]
MPQCPICKAAVWVGERYCVTCNNYLPHPEEEDHFCPRCSIRVAPQQEICHRCKAALPAIAGTPSTASPRGSRPLFGVRGIVIGTGLVIVALLLVFLFKKSSGPPQLVVTPPPQAPAEQTPVAPPIRPTETAPSAPAAQDPAVLSAPTTPSPPNVTTPTPSPPLYVVNAHSLALRDGPAVSAPQIATLNFHDEVELLETSGGWGRVRDVRRNIVGWSNMRYLTAGSN